MNGGGFDSGVSVFFRQALFFFDTTLARKVKYLLFFFVCTSDKFNFESASERDF
jgi:hypothetical protein